MEVDIVASLPNCEIKVPLFDKIENSTINNFILVSEKLIFISRFMVIPSYDSKSVLRVTCGIHILELMISVASYLTFLLFHWFQDISESHEQSNASH